MAFIWPIKVTINGFTYPKVLIQFQRDGFCQVISEDVGNHSVCAIVTDEFLQMQARLGNDLITPYPAYQFPGLKAGDRWCLCAGRFLQAHEEGCAPQVQLESTHQKALDIVPIEILRLYATPK